MPKVLQNAPREHSAILLTCIKLPSIFKTFGLSISEWPLTTGFTVNVNPWKRSADNKKHATLTNTEITFDLMFSGFVSLLTCNYVKFLFWLKYFSVSFDLFTFSSVGSLPPVLADEQFKTPHPVSHPGVSNLYFYLNILTNFQCLQPS